MPISEKLIDNIQVDFIKKIKKESSLNEKIFLLSFLTFFSYKFAEFKFSEMINQEFNNIIGSFKEIYKGKMRLYFKNSVLNKKHFDYILIDSYCWAGRGMSFQYLNSIFSLKKSILVIYTGNKYPDKQYLNFLQKNNIPFLKLKEQINANQIINNSLILANLSCNEIIFHTKPWSIAPFIYSNSIKSKTKSIIDLTDHAYCFGYQDMDKIYVWREFGLRVCNKFRNLKNKTKFLLIPLTITPSLLDKESISEGDFIKFDKKSFNIICGGTLSKIYDNKMIFFEIIQKICKLNKKIKIYIAGGGNHMPLINFIKKNKLQKQIFYIGFREDISNIISKADALLTTYPIGGGLMSQIAIHHGTAILSLVKKELINTSVETTGNIKDLKISSFTMSDLLRKVEKLINDKKFLSWYSKQILSKRTTQKEHKKLFKRNSLEEFSSFRNKYQNDNEIKKYIKNWKIHFIERESDLYPTILINFLIFKYNFKSHKIDLNTIKIFLKITYIYSIKSYFGLLEYMISASKKLLN